MKFANTLLEGKLLARYKRFFADVEYQGEKFTIHVPNTGSLKGVLEKGIEQNCRFTLHGDETKKLKGTLEAIQTSEGTWVGVNTSNPNKIVTEAIENAFKNQQPFLPHWAEYTFYKPEFKINKETRLDGCFVHAKTDLLDEKKLKHFIEIKNTTYKAMVKGVPTAQFPDAETERGQKHLKEMMLLMKQGHRCELIYTVQRTDVEAFSACREFDPVYADLLNESVAAGLIVTPLIVEMNQQEIKLTTKKLKFNQV